MMGKQCAACEKRGKTWSGDNPTCCFSGDRFDPQGWNCATANNIRSLVHEFDKHPLVDYRYCDDQKYATVDLHAFVGFDGLALWVTWYKNRGRTEAMWLLDTHGTPRKPTEDECLQIIRYAWSIKPFEVEGMAPISATSPALPDSSPPNHPPDPP